MTSLASTLDEEAKSASLAERSREMAREYGQRAVTGIAADLHQLSALASGLASLAADADDARYDARQQAEWQVATLAETENRLKRLEERATEVRRAVRQAHDDREQAHAQGAQSGMARNLLSSSRTQDRDQSRNPE